MTERNSGNRKRTGEWKEMNEREGKGEFSPPLSRLTKSLWLALNNTECKRVELMVTITISCDAPRHADVTHFMIQQRCVNEHNPIATSLVLANSAVCSARLVSASCLHITPRLCRTGFYCATAVCNVL